MKANNKLAEALKRVHEQAKSNDSQIVQSAQILRKDRELLLRQQWLQEIMQGWYMLVQPSVITGDSTAWYINYWDFVRNYLNHHYDDDYCLSAESSLDLHLAKSTIPNQVVVMSKQGGGKTVRLPHGTSILVYSDAKNIPDVQEKIRGINVMPLAYALCKVSPTFFRKSPQDAEIALRLIRDASELARIIINENLDRPAARLIGAYQFLGDDSFATNLKNSIATQRANIKPENPFENQTPLLSARVLSPYVARIKSTWAQYRTDIIKHFPKPLGLPTNSNETIQKIEENYKSDAYNSLSIEGFQVSEALIERVKNNHWSPESNPNDNDERNALAARGYYEAFQQVKKTILAILSGDNPGEIMQTDLSSWYQSLFNPMVNAKIIQPVDLIGYRNDQVYIRNSRHTPLPVNALLDVMDAFFDCLIKEEHAGVRAILGHFVFVYIHPYMDGNGRLGRFIMNAMLIAGGYPWTIVHVKNRVKYLSSLETASVDNDIIPFTKFIAAEMEEISNKQ